MSTKSKLMGSTAAVAIALVAWSIYQPAEDQTSESITKEIVPIEKHQAPVTQSLEKAPASVERVNLGEESEDQSADWNAAEFAPSLADTDIDGALVVDEHGNLEITLDLKDFYDYFFSAVGERTEEEVYQEIERQIALRLEGEAASQAIALMYDYVDYQRAQQELMAKKLVAKDLQDYQYYAKTMADAFHTLKDFRREFFSPEVADAFFALDEIHAEYAVTVLEIQANPALSDEEKKLHIQTVESQLPESMRAAEQEANERAELAAKAKALFNDGGSPEEIHELLSDRYDPDVVDNLLGFYEREDKWRTRISEYFTEKEAILKSGLSEVDQNEAILSLKRSMFEADEFNRVGSEEAIAEANSRSKERESTSS